MLDIRFIRENPTLIQQVAKHKGIEISIDELLIHDKERRELLQKVERLRSDRNRLSQDILQLAKQGRKEEMEQTKEQVRQINTQIKQAEDQLGDTAQAFHSIMQLVPNVVSPDTPIGESDEDNVEIRRVGNLPTFNFDSKDHVLLGEMHELFDIPRGVKVAGTRNYFLSGAGLYLHRAVQQLALDLLTERGFTAMDVPLMMREDTLYNTGFFPLGREQTYEIEKEEKWLVGTAEVPLVSYYSNEEVNERPKTGCIKSIAL